MIWNKNRISKKKSFKANYRGLQVTTQTPEERALTRVTKNLKDKYVGEEHA